MAIEDPNLRQLHETTFEWLTQHGEPTPAGGVEQTLAPDGLPIVNHEAEFSFRLTGSEAWNLDPDAAQILGVDDEHGALRLGAFESAYNRDRGGDLVYRAATTLFVVVYPGEYHLEETAFRLVDEREGLESETLHVYRSGADRELFTMTTDDIVDGMLGISGDDEIGEGIITGLSSIVGALKRRWPELKAAREASEG